MDAVTRAAEWMPYLVANAGLLEPHARTPADTVLVTAASSSVGLAATAVANRIGVVPVATIRPELKASQLPHVIVAGESATSPLSSVLDPVTGSFARFAMVRGAERRRGGATAGRGGVL